MPAGLMLEMAKRIFRKLAAPASLPLALFLRIALRSLKPFLHIRFVRWSSCSLGTWAIPTEVYLCQRDAGTHPRRSLDIFYHFDRDAHVLYPSDRRKSRIANEQLDKMFRPHLHLWDGARFLDSLNRLLPRGGDFLYTLPQPYDQEGLLDRFPAHLAFTREEEERGRRGLRALGIPPDAPFVCFHARDGAYAPRVRPGVGSFYGNGQGVDVRDSAITNYLPAIEELTRRGFYAVRMGKVVKGPLHTDNPRIMDYAWNHHCDFMDVYLSRHCAFFIGQNSGMTTLPILFRRPLVLVNVAPFAEVVYASYRNSLFIPKIYFSREKARPLTFREILSHPLLFRFLPHKYSDLPEIRDELGLEVQENSPEEIAELALEMHGRLQGAFQPSGEDEELRRRFTALLSSFSHVLDPVPDVQWMRIGTHFLRNHRELLEGVGEECLSS
ncbi:MAG: TIGR04372 family glycosyltransferase [Candidatus Omnitrophica bacterium]|nr:TIGR04372 family glycosyltransferase [Candidatus Omnitrophota bacterium]